MDRLPLVSSCIIQVAQDTEQPWPIEVYTHGGKAVNVTMRPGDMVLYESATVLHGRPFPMQGSKYVRPSYPFLWWYVDTRSGNYVCTSVYLHVLLLVYVSLISSNV